MNKSSSILKFIQPGKAFIFSKSYCPYCDRAKDLLKDLGVPFESVEVDQRSDLFPDKIVEEIHSDSGFRTYPKVYIGTKCVGGFTELQKVAKNLKLFELLKKEQIPFADSEDFN